jgi:hypothetical protein
MKIRPVGTDFFLADRRADGKTNMTKLIVAFRNFENAPKNETCFACACVRARVSVCVCVCVFVCVCMTSFEPLNQD